MNRRDIDLQELRELCASGSKTVDRLRLQTELLAVVNELQTARDDIRQINIAVELGAWRLMASQTGAVDEVRSCRKTQPQDVLNQLAWFRDRLAEGRAATDEVEKLRAELETARALADVRGREIERLTAERDAMRVVCSKLVACFDDDAIAVDHTPVDDPVGGYAEHGYVCGEDRNACSRATCPQIWVVNDADRLANGRFPSPDAGEWP